MHDAEPVPQGRSQQPRPGRGADQREVGDIQLDGPRRRSLSDHDVNLVILHGGVEDLFHHRAEAVYLVDKQHVPGFQVGQQRRQVAGPLQYGARGLAQVHPQFIGDNMRQGRFPQPGRTEDQHVVHGLGTLARGADENFHLFTHDRLAAVITEPARAQGAFHRLVLLRAAR